MIRGNSRLLTEMIAMNYPYMSPWATDQMLQYFKKCSEIGLHKGNRIHMPKKQRPIHAVKTPADELESQIKLTISKCRALDGLTEIEQFETIEETLDILQDWVQMRIDEIDQIIKKLGECYDGITLHPVDKINGKNYQIPSWLVDPAKNGLIEELKKYRNDRVNRLESLK